MAHKVFFTWDIHYKCNYNCTYCFLHFEPETVNIEAIYLAPEEWITIWTDIYKRYGSCHILVTGGEPFTYPNFIDLISILSKMHTFSFSTNLSWDINEFIKKVDKERVEIESSFHPEFMSLERFLTKVNLLRDNDYLIGVTVVAYPPLLDKIIDYTKIFKKERLKLNIYPYRGPYQSRKYPGGYTQLEKNILEKLGVEVGTKPSRELMEIYNLTGCERPPVEKEKKLCRMGQRYAKIIPNGDAYRCCAGVNKDWGRLGNITKGTFNLLDEPEFCPDYGHCRCYKSMVVGEEERWVESWKVPQDSMAGRFKERELEMAKASRDAGKIKEAINKINEILAEKPNDIKALTLLGEIYLTQEDFTTSEKVLQNALKNNLNPNHDSWIYRTLGKLYREVAILPNNQADEKRKKMIQSIDYLTKAIESADKSRNLTDKTWAHFEIAHTYYNQKDYSQARENLDIVFEYEPENEYFKKLYSLLEKTKMA